MLLSNVAVAGDAFEVVSVQFNESVSVDDQKALMEKLNDVVKVFDGFKSRDYFYSGENGRWIDFVVWSDVSLAKKASEQIMGNPVAGEIFSHMDEKSLIFSHYDRIGGTKSS